MKRGLGFAWPVVILAAVMAFMIILKPVQTVSEEEAYTIEVIKAQLEQQKTHTELEEENRKLFQDEGELPVLDIE
ncbi:hypothetical protein J2S00_001301 [Caldalkalibacillus uzonensis]|uniref:Septum formation initiator n=1 Tax=Caldalkalibacillus uzonensis TaxID=353224 RepID=A0ABU0CQ26_9BACI|nr:hypothetical protein [Caldalkalibacillus uzonensis]MDQ0338515.1 hypothetical protein [Caldalkalibacillus uzonensis]